MRSLCSCLTLLTIGCVEPTGFAPEVDETFSLRPTAAEIRRCRAIAGLPNRVRVDGVPVADLAEAVATSQPGSVIELSGGLHHAVGVDIPHELTVRGPCGSWATRLAGDGTDTILAVEDGVALTLEGVSLAGGGGRLIASGRRNGGAVLAGASTTLTLEDVEILGNEAMDGGGLYLGPDASLTMGRSSIRDNHAVDPVDDLSLGGGLVMEANGTLVMDRSQIGRNSAVGGGGVMLFPGGTCDASRSVVADNLAATVGGGLWAVGSVHVRGLDILRNESAGDGGGLSADSLRMIDVRMFDNRADHDGGGIVASGTVSLSHVVLDGNESGFSGAAVSLGAGSLAGGQSVIEDSTLTKNRARLTHPWAAAVTVFGLPPVQVSVQVVNTDWGDEDDENLPTDLALFPSGLTYDHEGVASFNCASTGGTNAGCL